MVDSRLYGSDHEGSPKGYNSIKLPANNLPLQNSLLLSGIIGSKMSRHATQYMTRVQKGVHSGHRGTKHQLVIDRAVSRDCKIRKTNLCTSRIDYKSYEKHTTQCHIHRYWSARGYTRSTGHYRCSSRTLWGCGRLLWKTIEGQLPKLASNAAKPS